jgi:hypothetical protein
MKWITHQWLKIARIACSWLIKKFLNKDARFIYVPKEQVFEKAGQLDAIPYNIPGSKHAHYWDDCTFGCIIRKHQLTGPSLLQLAKFMRGADTDRFDLAPQAAGYGLFQPVYLIICRLSTKCYR